jgi:hypothetical protein
MIDYRKRLEELDKKNQSKKLRKDIAIVSFVVICLLGFALIYGVAR